MRASEFGGCVRALVAKELGYAPLDPPPRMQKVFDAGNDAEAKALAVLERKGWRITRHQEEVEFLGITGHIDGFSEEDNALVEIKSMGKEPFAQWLDRGFEMGGLMPRYQWQTDIYRYGLPTVEWGISKLALVGYSRENGTVHILTRDLPFHTEAAIRARVDLINRYVEMGELPPCDQNAYPCPFVYLHMPEEKDRDALVEELGEQYRALQAQLAALQGKERDHSDGLISKLKVKIVEAMGTRDTVDTPTVRVHRYEQQNPSTIDRKGMEKDGVLGKYLIPGSKSERLKVTLREAEQEEDGGLGTSKD